MTLFWHDQDGGGNTDTLVTQVNNAVPTLEAGADESIRINKKLKRDFHFADPGADSWIAMVDYGDGTVEELQIHNNKKLKLDHRYRSEGVFQVRVSVLDDDLGLGEDTFFVTVGGGGGALHPLIAGASAPRGGTDMHGSEDVRFNKKRAGQSVASFKVGKSFLRSR